MPFGWRLSVGGVPVASVPLVGSISVMHTVVACRVCLLSEAQEHLAYAPGSPLWPEILFREHEARIQAYDAAYPLVRHNKAWRHALWDRRTNEQVVAPYRAQAAVRRVPVPPGGGRGVLVPPGRGSVQLGSDHGFVRLGVLRREARIRTS